MAWPDEPVLLAWLGAMSRAASADVQRQRLDERFANETRVTPPPRPGALLRSLPRYPYACGLATSIQKLIVKFQKHSGMRSARNNDPPCIDAHDVLVDTSSPLNLMHMRHVEFESKNSGASWPECGRRPAYRQRASAIEHPAANDGSAQRRCSHNTRAQRGWLRVLQTAVTHSCRLGRDGRLRHKRQ